jgi:hypothetical protein
MCGLARQSIIVAAGIVLTLAIGGCGEDAAPPQGEAPTQSMPSSPAPAGRANACPADGCKVRIVSASRAGRELRIELEANYAPDISRNHFHIYWSTYTAEQVSGDAEPRFGVTQGVWVPTADNPFTTADPVSVRMRKNARQICVTTGDRYHNVIDADLASCRDVRRLL